MRKISRLSTLSPFSNLSLLSPVYRERSSSKEGVPTFPLLNLPLLQGLPGEKLSYDLCLSDLWILYGEY